MSYKTGQTFVHEIKPSEYSLSCAISAVELLGGGAECLRKRQLALETNTPTKITASGKMFGGILTVTVEFDPEEL